MSRRGRSRLTKERKLTKVAANSAELIIFDIAECVKSGEELVHRQSGKECINADHRRPVDLDALDVFLFPKLRESLWVGALGLFRPDLCLGNCPALEQGL